MTNIYPGTTVDLLWKIEHAAEAQLSVVAAKVVDELQNGPGRFCLGLVGDLGAGKTALVAVTLRALGLPLGEEVSSPTYTICSEYQAKGFWYAHLDLYRLPQSEDIWGQLGIGETRPYRGFFVEWPERDASLALEMTHLLNIEFAHGSETRNYAFFRSRPV